MRYLTPSLSCLLLQLSRIFGSWFTRQTKGAREKRSAILKKKRKVSHVSFGSGGWPKEGAKRYMRYFIFSLSIAEPFPRKRDRRYFSPKPSPVPPRDWGSLALWLLQHLMRNQSFWVLGRVWSQGWNLKELTEGHHQEWSLRLNLTQHGKTHQVQT